MTEDGRKKVLVRRPSRVKTDSRGRSVWVDPYETAKLELVSTQMLKSVLDSQDQAARDAIRKAVDAPADGVLARDTSTGLFEIINDDDLQAILDENQGLPKFTRPADVTLEPINENPDDPELSLVSTLALRRVLGDDTSSEQTPGENPFAGFDPYDSN